MWNYAGNRFVKLKCIKHLDAYIVIPITIKPLISVAHWLPTKLLITQMLEHRLSALLQLHLHSRPNAWLQRIGRRQLHDETGNISVLGFDESYIRGLTVQCSFHGDMCTCTRVHAQMQVAKQISYLLNHWYDECIFITFIILNDTVYLSVLSHFCKDTIVLNNIIFYKIIYSVILLASDQKPFESMQAWCSFYILDVCNRWDISFKLFNMTNLYEIEPQSLRPTCHEYLSHCFVHVVWHIMANKSIYHYQSVRTSKKTTKSSAMLNNASERLCFSSATRGGSSSSSDEVQRSQFELSNSIPAAICRLDALISVLSAKEAGRNHIIVICEIQIDNLNTSRNGPSAQMRLCTYVLHLFQFKWESVICLYLIYIR